MDIDKLFKAGGNKRRMPDAPTPEMLKRMKLDSGEAAVAPAGNGKARKVIVEDMDEDMAEEDVGEGIAPGGDADYFAEEDEEGRFFGGGLTSEQKEILNIFDKAGSGDAPDDFEALNATGVRKLLLRLERAAKKNSDQRSKYPDDPAKFIDSEADLDAAIKALLPLAQVPNVAYPELIKSGQVEMLVGLLSHENADIALDIIELVHELTDEDVGDEGDEDEEDTAELKEEALKGLIAVLVCASVLSIVRALMHSQLDLSILELLVDNMTRFNEAEDADRQGIFHVLGIFENIVGSNPALAERLILKTKLLPWLLQRIQSKTHDANRGYAAELLSILLQESRPNRLELGKADGVETLLTVTSRYRKRDPVDADETEYMENVFDCLCSALSEPEIKELFLKSEGVDLMVLMMKEKMQSRSRCIKTLDHAMSSASGSEACDVFIQASGLKHLFSALMGKTSKKQKGSAAAQTPAPEDTTHVLGILSSLFTNLPSDSDARIRLLAKFVENNYEKTDKLLDIRSTAAARLATVDREIAAEKKVLEMDEEEVGEEQEDAWYLRRLDGGLYTLQTVDYILAWIIMEDDGIRAHARQMLDRRSKSFKDIAATLRIFHDNVGEPGEAEPPGALSQREILSNLITFVDSC
ncbi:Catenin-beta-like protein [Vararia minispora EC-137]|uniref:Catenin-beta-like protein n=1 Tax=Vararia minispora EC-137 TaxID=1314806 RepID=A0ACB8QW15_9AGAM|nr:Catenin-beta-like protein [Vararia minispora EC-137]